MNSTDTNTSQETQWIDFSRSFLSWVTLKEQSYGRFSIESKCTIVDLESKDNETFYLATAVMAGNVYAPDNLTKEPTYMFQIAASERHFQIFHDHIVGQSKGDAAGDIDNLFETISIIEKNCPGYRVKISFDIASLALSSKPLNARMSFENDGFQFVLDFPIRHINIQHDRKKFQVETGPVLVPAYSLWGGRVPDNIRTLQLHPAYILFNCLDRVELVLRQPPLDNQTLRCLYSNIEKVQSEIYLITPLTARIH